MTKLLIVLLIGLCFEAAGVVGLSKGLKEIGEVQKVNVPEVWRIFKKGITNANILFGTLRRRNIRHTQQVFGLLQNARVNEDYLLKLLPRLPRGDSELYSHPSLDEFKHEFDALVSTRVKSAVREQGIQLIRYQDL